jgi:hypothetical protein
MYRRDFEIGGIGTIVQGLSMFTFCLSVRSLNCRILKLGLKEIDLLFASERSKGITSGRKDLFGSSR